MSSNESSGITLEDVELAIKILEKYLRHVERARSILARFSMYQRRSSDVIELAKWLMAQKKEEKEEEVEEPELSEEEIKRFREVARKYISNKQ
jgi:DNA replicative helicase MCM subunit Mcm2 (Cdc46/Mcm family)